MVPSGRIAIGLMLLALCSRGHATDIALDAILRKAIHAYQLTPHRPAGKTLGPKERLGQALFFDPVVSGPKNIACAACHVRSLGAGDGLRMAVGLGSRGVGAERLSHTAAFIVPRNALPFFNRGSSEFRAFFWDGRVQLGMDGQFESPLGVRLPHGFDSLLAVASVFPLVEPDEMLGRSMGRSSALTYHAELVSRSETDDNFQERTLHVFGTLVERLVGAGKRTPERMQLEYRALFSQAYPGTPIEQFRIHHIGNALAAYITAAFDLQSSPWDRYVSGEVSALTPAQKEGAFVFFGKGRCAVCHSGTQFSDFRFHGIAVPQLRVGKHVSHIDYGRAAATSRGEDRFAFRTPPLRNVATTRPWGHNGLFSSLESVIKHHGNPVPILYQAQQEDPEEAAHAGRLLGFRSPILVEMAPLSGEDIRHLVDFLKSLSSDPAMPYDVAIPKRVLSGDGVFIRK